MQQQQSTSTTSTSSFVSTSDGDVEVTTHIKYNSPRKGSARVRTHSRNLSAHFVDAAKLTDDTWSSSNTTGTSIISTTTVKSIMKQSSSLRNNPNTSNGDLSARGNSNTNSMTVRYAKPLQDPPDSAQSSNVNSSNSTLKKRHRRNQSSGGSFNSVLAHRRVNSRGSSVAVLQKNHFRENSEGLDILSAVADLTEEDMAAVAGSKGKHLTLKSFQSNANPKNIRSHSRIHSLMGGPIDLATGTTSSMITGIERGDTSSNIDDSHKSNKHGTKHGRAGSLLGSLDHTGTALLMSLLPLDSNSRDSLSQATSQKPSHERKHSLFLLPEQGKHDRNMSLVSEINPNVFTMGSGLSPITSNVCTSVAEQAKPGNLSINANIISRPATNTDPHHRTISSLGMMASLLPNLAKSDAGSSYNANHRQKSSNLSSHKILLNLEESIDANIPGGSDFLRGLTENSLMNEKKPNLFCPPPMLNKPRVSIEIGRKSPTRVYPANIVIKSSDNDKVDNISSSKLKRMRRKCNIEGCPNRVVQGGVCIAHGAKRKTCQIEGCDKNVKKAGYCSAHGPARKRCDFDSCERVAVQGGRCISHGAKKRLCQIVGCTKQGILSSMCKKHHDERNKLRSVSGASTFTRNGKQTDNQVIGNDSSDSNVCVIISNPDEFGVGNMEQKEPPSPPQHTRRESFRGDNATVQAIFKSENPMNIGANTNDSTNIAVESEAPAQRMPSRKHKRGISLFSDENITDSLLRNNLII